MGLKTHDMSFVMRIRLSAMIFRCIIKVIINSEEVFLLTESSIHHLSMKTELVLL